MTSAMERLKEEQSRRSRSPARDRERRGTPPRRRSSPERRKDSPARARRDRERSPSKEKVKERVRSPQSPAKASLSHKGRERSPPREKAKDQRVRSPKRTQEQSRSPSPARRHVSSSPSPRTKRLRRAQGEREVAQVREELDTVRHREHDEGRGASRDRKVDRGAVQVTNGDRHKSSHREERDSQGKHREHDEGRDRDASRDRKLDRDDTRGTTKDKKSDRDDGKDHSRERRAGRDDKSGASKETSSSRDGDRHGRPNRDDWKSASSREQRVDRSDRKDSTREKPTNHEEIDGGSGRSSRHGRSVSSEEHRHRGRHESHPSPRVSRSAARTEVLSCYCLLDTNSRGGEESRSGDPDALTRMNATAEALEANEKPSFELSGKLAEETNRVAGVNLLYSEPPEARKSEIRWRLYVFKDGEPLNEPLYVHRMTCYLFGRERKVADVATDHPSCSKQHAVLQYRLVEKEQPDGMMAKKIRPYLMDLDSTNGTFINGNRIEPRRYYELFEKDTLKFGNSSREYVLLHENSTE